MEVQRRAPTSKDFILIALVSLETIQAYVLFTQLSLFGGQFMSSLHSSGDSGLENLSTVSVATKLK